MIVPAYLRRRSYGLTDVGRKRPQNEDAFLADDTLGLYVVADGVGGHAKGEVASAESVEQVRNFVCSGYEAIERFLYGDAPEVSQGAAALGTGSSALDPLVAMNDENRLALRRLLESAVQSACYFVYGMALQDPTGTGMSTTLSALLVAGDHAVVAQVGDSRVYRLRGGQAEQVTIDHTLINHQLQQGLITPEQALTMRGRNVITRAVGHRDYVEVDTFALDLEPGDRFLICSDGLHGYLMPGEVEDLLAEPSVEAAARRSIEVANGRGGKDNITAVIVDIAA
jgi:protein phosphatase